MTDNEKRICSGRGPECRKIKCKGAYVHKCGSWYKETHGCKLYISQPPCERINKTDPIKLP